MNIPVVVNEGNYGMNTFFTASLVSHERRVM